MKKGIIYVVAVVVLLLASVTVCYADDRPPINFDNEVIMLSDGNGGWFAVSFQKEAIIPVFNGTEGQKNWSLQFSPIEGMSQYAFYSCYKWDGQLWKIHANLDTVYVTQQYQSVMGGFNKDNLVYSDVNVVDRSGNLVFPPPRPVLEELLEKTAMTIPKKVGGVQKTLTLCGVGCLALLTALSLFGKVLSRFRVK